jgi:hypothetical protein
MESEDLFDTDHLRILLATPCSPKLLFPNKIKRCQYLRLVTRDEDSKAEQEIQAFL